MKLYRTLSAAALLLAAVHTHSWAQTATTTEGKKVTAEQASYALGTMVGRSIEETLKGAPGGKNLDKTIILKSITEYFSGNSQLSPEDAGNQLNSYFEAAQIAEAEARKAEGEKFLAENAKKKGVKVTESGLQYKILVEGKGIKPTVEDTVQVHYRGRLIDGTEFDSSYSHGEPIKFSPLQVIPGWTEGLCLLRKGDKAELYIPASLAYGERGAGNKIPPHSVLIFEIEMLDVIKGEPIPVSDISKVDDKGAAQKADSKEAKASSKTKLKKK